MHRNAIGFSYDDKISVYAYYVYAYYYVDENRDCGER